MIICENCTNWKTMDEAKEMIKVAHEVGAGLSKFQLFDAEDDKGTWKYEYAKAHELTFEQAKELFDYGASIGQEVFFSVFGVKYVEWCEKIGVKRYKIACEFRDKITLKAVRATKKPIILSTSNIDWKSAHNTLYCISRYPTELKDLHFNSMVYHYGFSDHTIGLDAAKIALARGASIIEKHFVLKHDPYYLDDAWSMTPDELKELVRFEKVCKEVL